MKWYFPSWNGDHRLEPHPKNPEHTVLTIQKPTIAEAVLLDKLGEAMITNGWITTWAKVTNWRSIFQKKVTVRAPLEQVGPLFVWVFKPGPAVLTAVRYENGRVVTTSDGVAELVSLSKQIAEAAKEPEAPQPKAAATVKRPTPCCPDCIPGSVAPASEVLLAFLSDAEHETWARERAIYVEGGLSGARYRIAHRHSPIAQKQSRICRDMDLGVTVHFHDSSVPPEEEVLAAKLILEHREPWLRNEATMLGVWGQNARVFKNPFGDGLDGVADAALTTSIGAAFSFGGSLL